MEYDAVTNSQCSRREAIEENPVTAGIYEDVLEENIFKALSLTGVNIVPEDFHTCHRMKRSDRVIVKFKCWKQKQSLMYKRKNLGTKFHFWEDFLLTRVCPMKTSSLLINVDNARVPERYILSDSLTML